MKTVRTTSLFNKVQSGFALLPVAIALVVVASIILLINFQGASSVNRVASDLEANQAHYIAQAGMQHAIWQAQNSKCTGDFTIPTTTIGSDSYIASTTGGGTTTSYTLSVDQDAWIRSDDTTSNNGANADLHIRFETGKVEQPLVRFDLSTLPANAQINSAALWFYIESGKEHPEGPVTIHRITSDWIESDVTWDSFNGSYDATALGTIGAQASSDVWVQVNITSQVQAWVNGEPNFGVLLNSIAEGIHGEYISSEGASGKHPRLEVIVGNGPASPLAIQATGSLQNGITRTLSRPLTLAYQTPSSLNLQLGTDPGIDAMLNSFYNNRDYGNHELQVSIGSGSTIENALLQFELSAIPSNSRIISAQLELYHYVTTGTPVAPGVDVYQLTRSWVEGTHDGTGSADGATWNTWDGNSNWTSAGGDYNATPVASSAISVATADWESWEIGELVQGWIDGSYPNYGLILKGTGVLDVSFASKEDADPALHPKLNITYAIECGMVSLLPQGSGSVLMVIGNSPSNPSTHEQELRDVIESWGYSVTFIQDDDSQGNFDAQAATHDVVYVSETVSSANVGTKLTNLSIGVVNEQGNLNDELGMASGKANPIGTSVNIVDNSHYITYPFQSGSLEIFSKDMEGLTVSGSEASGLQTLTDWSGTGSLVVLDKGMQTTSGDTAAGRRVMLPLGRSTNSNFNWDYLNNNGRLLVQRALQWGAGNIAAVTVNLLMVVVNPDNLTTQEAAKKALLESWDYTVNLIDESDSQTAFDDAVAVNKVVFITEDVTASTVNTKLVNATIGVVTEEANLADEFGFSETIFWGSGTQIKTEGTHFIVEPFPAGNVDILSVSESLAGLTGARAPDLDIVAESPAGIGPAALEIGASVINGRTAAGRRVFLPWGGNNMDVNHLTDDGLTILQRALEWGASTSEDTTSPIAHWKLDDGTGVTAVDSEGGHDGTLTNGPLWETGQLGGALRFDGSDDYVDLTSDAELDDVFDGGATVMAWIYPTGWGENGYGRIFDKSSSPSSTNDGWVIRMNVDNGGIINFGQGFTSGRGWWKIPDSSISLNTWQHIAIAYDASSTSNDPEIYLDGSPLLVTEVDSPSGSIRSDASINLRLGNHAGGTSHTFDGKIDDARIYDQMLTQTEIAAVANEEGAGGYYLDQFNAIAYNGNDGTLDWSNDWQEWGDDSNVTGGKVQVVACPSGLTTDCLRFGIEEKDAGASRLADLSLASEATLSFDWRRSGDYYSNRFTVEVRRDAGSWLQLLEIPDGYETSVHSETLSIPAKYFSTNTEIRFVPKDWGDGYMYVDNVRIDLDTSGGGGSDPASTCAADDFETDDYTGNTGDFDWNGNWVEVNENTNPGNGDEQVVTQGGGNHVARVRDNDGGGEGILRSVDLSVFTSATLNFNYWRDSLDNSNDYVSVQVWPNASDEWEEVLRIEGPGTDDAGSPQSASHDISAFIMNDTHIRFITSPNMGSSDSVYFDNIEVCGQ